MKTDKNVGQEEFAMVNPQDLKEKFNLSDDDISFLTNPDRMLGDSDVIGANKYYHLLSLKRSFDRHNELNPGKEPKYLSEKELQQLAAYEANLVETSEEAAARRSEYEKSVREPETKPKPKFIEGLPITKRSLYFGFLEAFKHETGFDFVQTPDNIKNLEALCKYFSRDETFFQCDSLVKNINGVELKPSFSKGLLLVGRYGNGKSTMMKCFAKMINHNFRVAREKQWDNTWNWMQLRFAMAYCHNLVIDFDGLEDPSDKSTFFKKYKGFVYCFDDLTKEDKASNYGRKEIIRVILENRYEANSATHGTINFPDDAPGDIKAALMQMAYRYGGHIYDRSYEMFNIIDFKGKSFRK